MMRLLTTLFLILTIVPRVLSTSAQQDVPYIYYYSRPLGGFVVERADGLDSRLFSQGDVAGFASAHEPGWSPSGEWFGWYNVRGYAERVDGEVHFDVFATYGEAFSTVLGMEWLSVEDHNWLWIEGKNLDWRDRASACIDCNVDVTFVLRDVDTEATIVQISLPVSSAYTYFHPVSSPEWLSDENTLRFYIVQEGDIGVRYVQVTVDSNGAVSQTEISEDEWEACCVYIPPQSGAIWPAVDSPSGRYQVTAGQITYLYDRETSEVTELPLHSNAHFYRQTVNFSPFETWLLTGQTGYEAGQGGTPLWMGVSNIRGSYWREIGRCFECADWLPPQVNPRSLSRGQELSVLLAPTATEYQQTSVYGYNDNRIFDYQRGNYTLTCPEDAPGERIVSPLAGEGEPYRLQDERTCYLNSPQEVLAVTSPNGEYLALREEEGVVSLWQAQTGELISRLNTNGFELWFSEDNTLLYTRATRAVHTWNIADVIQHAQSLS